MSLRTVVVALSFVLAFVGFATRPAWAWPEEPFAQIELSGPTLTGITTFTSEALDGMTIQNFMSGDRIQQPTQLGPMYELHRYVLHKGGRLWDFDRVRYYTDPAGGLGYVEYVEAIGYGPSAHEGQWFRATAHADATMARLIASATPPPAIVAAPTSEMPLWVNLVIASVFGLWVTAQVRRLSTKAA